MRSPARWHDGPVRMPFVARPIECDRSAADRLSAEGAGCQSRVAGTRDDLEFARAVTFFDAIFAFSVTLLITTVDDFTPAAWSSLDALKEANGPGLFAFAISFVVVVSFWRANHQEVTGFTALDGRVLLLNCMVMFGVVLIPFATEALGKLDPPAAGRRLRGGDLRDLPDAAGRRARRGSPRTQRRTDDPPRNGLDHRLRRLSCRWFSWVRFRLPTWYPRMPPNAAGSASR